MALGVQIQLHNGSNPLGNLSNIQGVWWDVEEPKDIVNAVDVSSTLTTDASGNLEFILPSTSLIAGQSGFLLLYQLKTPVNTSLVFASKLELVEIGVVENLTLDGFNLTLDGDNLVLD